MGIRVVAKRDVGPVLAGAALFLWVFWVNSHTYMSGVVGTVGHPNLFACLGFCALAWLAPRESEGMRRVLDVAVTALGTASVLVAWLTGGFSAAVCLATNIGLGACYAWLAYRYVGYLLNRGLREVFSVICLGLMAFAALGFLMSLLSDEGGWVVGALLPVANMTLLRCLPDYPDDAVVHAPYYEGCIPELVRGPLLSVYGLCFVYSAANILLKVDYGSFAFGPGASLHVASLGCLVVFAVVAVCAGAVARGGELSFYLLVKAPALLLVCALVISGVFGSSAWLQVFTFPTVWVLGLAFHLLVVDVAQHCGGCGQRVAALAFAGHSLAYCLGRWLFFGVASRFEAGNSPALSETLCIILLGTLALVLALAFQPRTRVANLLFRDMDNACDLDAAREDGAFGRRCELFASDCRLSAREAEIMAYVAKGYSKPFIAEKLFISDNTVRTHVKRIYEKAGVHSRRELQERIEAVQLER